jgi:hypothetical protein
MERLCGWVISKVVTHVQSDLVSQAAEHTDKIFNFPLRIPSWMDTIILSSSGFIFNEYRCYWHLGDKSLHNVAHSWTTYGIRIQNPRWNQEMDLGIGEWLRVNVICRWLGWQSWYSSLQVGFLLLQLAHLPVICEDGGRQWLCAVWLFWKRVAKTEYLISHARLIITKI